MSWLKPFHQCSVLMLNISLSHSFSNDFQAAFLLHFSAELLIISLYSLQLSSIFELSYVVNLMLSFTKLYGPWYPDFSNKLLRVSYFVHYHYTATSGKYVAQQLLPFRVKCKIIPCLPIYQSRGYLSDWKFTRSETQTLS